MLSWLKKPKIIEEEDNTDKEDNTDTPYDKVPDDFIFPKNNLLIEKKFKIPKPNETPEQVERRLKNLESTPYSYPGRERVYRRYRERETPPIQTSNIPQSAYYLAKLDIDDNKWYEVIDIKPNKDPDTFMVRMIKKVNLNDIEQHTYGNKGTFGFRRFLRKTIDLKHVVYKVNIGGKSYDCWIRNIEENGKADIQFTAKLNKDCINKFENKPKPPQFFSFTDDSIDIITQNVMFNEDDSSYVFGSPQYDIGGKRKNRKTRKHKKSIIKSIKRKRTINRRTINRRTIKKTKRRY